MKTVKIICAWCGRSLGEKDGKGIEGVSHAICKSCLSEAKSRLDSVTGAAST